jgi:L-aspartate semialdehyde sulfurtransferase ferredoxin
MSTRVRFTYPPELLHKPIMYELGKQFGVVTNIRRANVSDTHGWIEMELVGAPLAIDAGLAWVGEQGLQVEAIKEPHGVSLGATSALSV